MDLYFTRFFNYRWLINVRKIVHHITALFDWINSLYYMKFSHYDPFIYLSMVPPIYNKTEPTVSYI